MSKLHKISGLPEEIGAWQTIEKSTKTNIKVYTTRKRYRKLVTIIEGLEGKEINTTAKELKHKLACGGSVKDNLVVLQGEHTEQVVQYLVKLGYPREAIKITQK